MAKLHDVKASAKKFQSLDWATFIVALLSAIAGIVLAVVALKRESTLENGTLLALAIFAVSNVVIPAWNKIKELSVQPANDSIRDAS